MVVARVLLSSVLLSLAACGPGEAERAAASAFPDPQSVKFQSVERNGGFTCGEANAREGRGAYTGYRRFIYDHSSGRTTIDPRAAYTEAEVAQFESSCRLVGAGGGSLDPAVCSRSAAARRAFDAQQRFESLWKRQCR